MTPAATQPKQRILLVDDHAIVREGFAELINSNADLEVCGQADTAARALDLFTRLKPDMIIVDLSLHGASGLELIKNVKAMSPQARMLVLSMHDESLYAERSLRAGAMGYVMKREESKTVLRAIRAVLNNEVFVSGSIRGRLLHEFVGDHQKDKRSGVSTLSDRELEVFQLLGKGCSTGQIARQLRVSVSTVETHRAHIKEKLQLNNATELMRTAVAWVSSH